MNLKNISKILPKSRILYPKDGDPGLERSTTRTDHHSRRWKFENIIISLKTYH